MIDQLNHRLSRAENKAKRLKSNPAPTLPKYDISAPQNYFAHLLHGPVYQIRNNGLVNGKIITVDYSHVPNLIYIEAHAAILKGLRFPNGSVDTSPWDDLPFGMSIGANGVGNSGTLPFVETSGSDPASSPSSLRPLQSEWRMTHGIHTTQAGSLADPIGGVRTIALLISKPSTLVQIVSPAPDDSANFEIVWSTLPCANGVYYDWRQGTTDYEVLSSGIWIWDIGDTPVPGNGFTANDGSSSSYDWFGFSETKVISESGYSYNFPYADAIKSSYNGILEFVIGSGFPSGLGVPVIGDGIGFFTYAITTQPLNPLDDFNAYPQSITDDSGGSIANRLVGRFSSSVISQNLSKSVPVTVLPDLT